MYYVYGISGSSLLIESTDSMMKESGAIDGRQFWQQLNSLVIWDHIYFYISVFCKYYRHTRIIILYRYTLNTSLITCLPSNKGACKQGCLYKILCLFAECSAFIAIEFWSQGDNHTFQPPAEIFSTLPNIMLLRE